MYKNYKEMRETHQKEMNEFPLMFAFGEKQFTEMLEKNNVKSNELVSIGYGGYVRKTDKEKFLELLDRHAREELEFASDFDNLVDMLVYELRNHEYGYTLDVLDTVDGLRKDITELPIFDEALAKAARIVKDEEGIV